MDSREFNLHFLLHCANLVEERLRHRLADLGIHQRQARVLDTLARMGTASQVSLAREFNITAASMSTMTARLIAAGLISRETDPDEARSNILRLTERGESLLSEIHAAWNDVDRMIETLIGPEKAATLSTLARELRDALGGHTPGKAATDPTNTPPDTPQAG